MRNLFLTAGAMTLALLISADASATTRSEANAMAAGTWPTQLACRKDDDGYLNGYREEAIVVTDAPEEGNVLTRQYLDPTCHVGDG